MFDKKNISDIIIIMPKNTAFKNYGIIVIQCFSISFTVILTAIKQILDT